MTVRSLPGNESPAVDYRQLVAEHGSPLLVLDGEALRVQYRALAAALPGVALHYAIKALPHPAALAVLEELDAGFDIATAGEIEMLWDLSVNPRRTIHTHPIKKDSEIRAALRFGCTTFVVDNLDELRKFRRYRHRVGLLLRVGVRAHDAVVDLSRKFGCAPEEVAFLLGQAKQLGIHIKGLSFHVGSQSGSAAGHCRAIWICNELIREARARELAKLTVLDIGGGFPVCYDATVPAIDAFCTPIREALAELPEIIQVLAEPGRFLAAPAMTAIASVVGRAWRGGQRWYYLDDGVYGAFSGQIYDHARYPLSTLSSEGELQPSVLAGPTCDSIDVIAEDIQLPELAIGDLVIGRMMGAYTWASASEFNSLPIPRVLVVNGPVVKPTLVRVA